LENDPGRRIIDPSGGDPLRLSRSRFAPDVNALIFTASPPTEGAGVSDRHDDAFDISKRVAPSRRHDRLREETSAPSATPTACDLLRGSLEHHRRLNLKPLRQAQKMESVGQLAAAWRMTSTISHHHKGHADLLLTRTIADEQSNPGENITAADRAAISRPVAHVQRQQIMQQRPLT